MIIIAIIVILVGAYLFLRSITNDPKDFDERDIY
jgi:hypothetical protein